MNVCLFFIKIISDKKLLIFVIKIKKVTNEKDRTIEEREWERRREREKKKDRKRDTIEWQIEREEKELRW